jgi:nitroimidazol reductase NimA-like FMN-containing flavoprotein (pyridoxamine 5'-phosphate oxidase superfamily)
VSTVPAVTLDDNGLVVLDRDDCLRLLGTATLGRVGISSGALPVVLPVNFRLVGDRIVFRTSSGTKLQAATRGAVVAFEVDSIEPFSHTGWSVCVTGLATAITDPAEIEQLRRAHVPRWARSSDDHFVTISTDMVSGRRLGIAPR